MSAILGLSFIQCSSTATKPPKYPDSTSFCNGMADAICNPTVLKNCGASDKAKCAASQNSACLAAYVTPALSLGHTYDSGQAETCVNAVSAAYPDDGKVTSISSDAQAKIDAACGAVFSGAGAKDSTCAVNADCQQGKGLSCVIHAQGQTASDAGELEGTCQLAQTVNGGASCSAHDAQCASGYHCGSTSHCDQNEALGIGCSNLDPCDTGLMCSAAGNCIAKSPAGTTCTSASECADGMCIPVTNSPSICAAAETLSVSEPFCTAIR